MTIATDRGFEIGKLYRIIEDKTSSYYSKGSVVKFVLDDNSSIPIFEYVSGTPRECTWDSKYYIDLDHLEPVEKTFTNNKELLVLYVQQHHPDDTMLNALVNSL